MKGKKYNNYLYFIIEEISDEFKECFLVYESDNKEKKEDKKIEDYIKFEDDEQNNIAKFKNLKDINEELIDKIKKEFIKKIKEQQISFKGETLNEIIS